MAVVELLTRSYRTRVDGGRGAPARLAPSFFDVCVGSFRRGDDNSGSTDAKDYHVWLLEREADGAPITTLVWRWMPVRSDGSLWAEALFSTTQENHRRHGYASQLVDAWKAYVLTSGGAGVCVSAVPDYGVLYWSHNGLRVLDTSSAPTPLSRHAASGPLHARRRRGRDTCGAAPNDAELLAFLHTHMLTFPDTVVCAHFLT